MFVALCLTKEHFIFISWWYATPQLLYPERSSTPLVHCIDNQPLLLDEDSPLYNVRKVTELPHCLAGCKRDEELRELLTDYDWLKASILTTSCEDVISTFHPVLPIVPLGRCC